MFVSDGNYIYSQYSGREYFTTEDKANVFVTINKQTQAEGINVVYGYAVYAGSGIEFYAKQFTVKYLSDPNGKITGITEEDIISGNTPSGSTPTPNKDYEFDFWTADKPITLTDGTTIPAGKPITMDQIKQVVVSEDLIFTAHHKAITPSPIEPSPKVPNTGDSTSSLNATVVTVSIIGVLLGALMIGLLPKIMHKKLTFKK